MNALIHAELAKLRSIRSFWGAVAATLAFVPVSVALSVHAAGSGGEASLESTEGIRNVMAAASSGGILMLIIGIVVMAGEFRFGTASSTFLITPNRARVVRAKLVASTIVGSGIGAVASLLTLAVALPWLSSRHVDTAGHATEIAVVLLGGTAATAIGGLVGVGIGALVTNQTLAITVALLWTLVIESMLTNFAAGIGRWFPGGAASAMSGVEPASGSLLPFWAAALLFAGYGLAFAAAGSYRMLRRDIT
jgi:ABC-type transport system involved in multi-copper enzyme maturation permease subunit